MSTCKDSCTKRCHSGQPCFNVDMTGCEKETEIVDVEKIPNLHQCEDKAIISIIPISA